MLNWLFGKKPAQRLKELATEIEAIDVKIAANTEAIAQKRLELQHLKDRIGRHQKALKEEENQNASERRQRHLP